MKAFCTLLLAFLCLMSVPAFASEAGLAETGSQDDTWSLEQLNLDGINRFLAEEHTQLPSFQELMAELMTGRTADLPKQLASIWKQSLIGELSHGSRMAIQVLMIGLTGAVLTGFATVFQEKQISDTSFFVVYLILASFLLAGFLDAIEIARRLAEQILEFMRALLPAYMLTIAWSGGTLTGAAWHAVLLFVITLAERILIRLVFPLMKVYLVLVLTGHLTGENLFSGFTRLIGQCIRWGLKSLFGIILGFHLIQGMVLPYADSVKNAGIRKALAVIPGIGAGADAVTQMMLGSGVLIKNTMGAAATTILLVLSALPVLKLFVLMLLYQMTGAVLRPVCDSHMMACLEEIAEGHKLLLHVVLSLLALFLVTIALICTSTNATYLA